jgi:hypothetical protein
VWWFKKSVAYLLLVVAVGTGAGAIFGIVKMLTLGYTYACVGQGCPYQTPGAVPWIYFATWGIPLSVFSFIGWVLLRQVTTGGPPADLGAVSSLPSSRGKDAWASAELRSSYEAGEPGRTRSLFQDATSKPRFHQAFHVQYLGTAVFELLLGSAFLVGAILSPAARFGWGLTAAILLAIGFGLLYAGVRAGRRVADAERLSTEGIRATAEIVGLTQTGVYLNKQPLLGIEAVVEIPGKEPYRIKKREYVPLIALGGLEVGRTVSVVVDPDDADKVLFSWDMG